MKLTPALRGFSPSFAVRRVGHKVLCWCKPDEACSPARAIQHCSLWNLKKTDLKSMYIVSYFLLENITTFILKRILV